MCIWIEVMKNAYKYLIKTHLSLSLAVATLKNKEQKVTNEMKQ